MVVETSIIFTDDINDRHKLHMEYVDGFFNIELFKYVNHKKYGQVWDFVQGWKTNASDEAQSELPHITQVFKRHNRSCDYNYILNWLKVFLKD